jgi:hypothetical protein
MDAPDFASEPSGRRGSVTQNARVVSAGTVAVLTAVAWVANAERPRIAVEHDKPDAASRRLLAEVRNAGLDPVDVRAVSSPGNPTAVADRYGAVAVLSLKRPGRIELAVLSPDTREVIYESTVTSKGGTPASVRAAEELHGRLIDLPRRETFDGVPQDASSTHADAPSPAEAVTPVTLEETPERRALPRASLSDAAPDKPALHIRPTADDPIRVWLGGGAGAMSGDGGFNRLPVAKLEVRFEPFRHFSLSALTMLPVAAQTVTAPEGSGDLRVRLVAGMLHATVINWGDVVRLSAGAGGGVALVEMHGHAAGPGLAGRSASATTGIGTGAIGLSVRLLPWLSLRADVTGALAAYRPVMRFDHRQVAAWGPDVLAFTGGLELDPFSLARGSR